MFFSSGFGTSYSFLLFRLPYIEFTLRAGLKTSKMWELSRKLDNNKTYSKIDDRQKGRERPFYEKFKMNISVEVLRPALSTIFLIEVIS